MMQVAMISYQVKPFLAMARVALCANSPNTMPPNGVAIKSWMWVVQAAFPYIFHNRVCMTARVSLPYLGALGADGIVIERSLVGMSTT